jgi:hypothetical protein
MSGPILGVVALLLAGAVRTQPVEPVSNGTQPPREFLTIEWSGSHGCRPTRDLQEGLRRLLGADPNALLTQEFAVRAAVTELPRGWTIALSATGPSGPMERNLSAPTCSEIAQAAALVISLWVQAPNLPEPETLPDEPAPVRELEPTAVEAPNRLERLPSASRLLLERKSWEIGRGRRFRAHLALGATVFSGALPRWGWGATGRIGVAVGAWRLDALALWLDSQDIGSQSAPSLGGRFNLLASGIRIAMAWPLLSALNAQPGIWLLMGRLHGEGTGALTQSTPSNDGWGAAGLDLDLELKIRRLLVTLGGGGGLPFGRPKFFLGEAPLYRTPPATWFGQFLVGTAFP